MKVELKLITQDPSVAYEDETKGTESFRTTREEHFLDGPVCRRVAVLDFDEKTGELLPGARFVPPDKKHVLGRYAIADSADLRARDFNQVSVFSTVLKTIYMFEDETTLGREIRWAFDAPQLLVVPRAGEMANAYYERDSHSLQFFSFPSELDDHGIVHTSLSHDIVSHECGHAILDGIAPDLFNAITPQALALHEAIADLVALVMAFSSNTLPKQVLDKTGGSIRDASAFSWLAEEFGRARDAAGRSRYLRSFLNDKTLDPDDTSVDENGEPNLVHRGEPHQLSQVLSGALYRAVVEMHENLRKSYAIRERKSEFSVSGKALAVAADRFKSIIFRALDYLPPGEISFADYARAILASDQASYPDNPDERERVRSEFVHRHMATPDELDVKTDFEDPAVAVLDLDTLVDSDWAAYQFVNDNRQLLGIPAGIPFRVRPRLDVTKLYYRKGREVRIRECILKVSWDTSEPNALHPHLPECRQITAGAMLAIDWAARRVRAVLVSDAARPRSAANLKLRQDRDDFLRSLVEQDVLQMSPSPGVNGVWIESTGELMRVCRAANLLHIVDGGVA